MRTIADSTGVVWTVFEVKRKGGTGEWTYLPQQFGNGWLCFESNVSKRRLTPVPTRWTEFTRRYAEELDKKTAAIAALAGAVRSGRVTLLFGARDEQHNTAVALHSYLTRAT